MIFGQAKKFTANTASITAPIGGWNARDSIAQMPATDAVTLTNLYPTPTDVTLRNGYTKYSTGITGRVNTLMNYAGYNSQKLFAVAGTKIYDTTTSTASQVFTVANDKFQYVNFSNTSGDYLVACNGVDPVTIYNGTSWFTIATTTTAQTISTITHVGAVATLTTASPHGLATGNYVTISGATASAYNGSFVITVTGLSTFTYTMASTPAADATVVGSYTVLGIKGGTTGGTTYTVNSNTFVHVNLFKNRLYFTQKDSMKVWYLGVDALGGDAFPLDFGGIANSGGFMQGMFTWTLDAGQGADDYAGFATNMGEVIVYNGTDPTDATTWLLKGVWQLGYIFSRRFFYKFAGDVLLLTQDGLVPLASALQSSRLDPRINITDKIYYEISKEADAYSSYFGWQTIYFAKPNMLLINIPNPSGTEQYVMHTISKAWCNFTGIDTTVFELHNDNLYFGGNGYVGHFWDGFADDGKPISGTCQQAYSYFDLPGQQKRFTMVRPTFLVDSGAPGVYAGINTDFQTQNNLGQVSFNPTPTIIAVWDVAKWDENIWAGNLTIYRNWQGVTGLGYCAGINMNIVSQGIDVHWISTDYVMEKGTVL
jgi:hypothetical protein